MTLYNTEKEQSLTKKCQNNSKLKKVLRQKDPLSPILFHIILEIVSGIDTHPTLIAC